MRQSPISASQTTERQYSETVEHGAVIAGLSKALTKDVSKSGRSREHENAQQQLFAVPRHGCNNHRIAELTSPEPKVLRYIS